MVEEAVEDPLCYPSPDPIELGPLYSFKLASATLFSNVIPLEPAELTKALEVKKCLLLSLPRLNMFRDKFTPPGKKEYPGKIREWCARLSPLVSDPISKLCPGPKASTIEIHFTESFARDVIQAVLSPSVQFGSFTFGCDKQPVYIEYSSPNIAKEFHAGHFRTTAIGNYLVQLHRAAGYQVIAETYFGDWGKQYGMLAVGYSMFGDDAKLKDEPIRHLYDIYVKINAIAAAEEKPYKEVEEAKKSLGYLQEAQDKDLPAIEKASLRLSDALAALETAAPRVVNDKARAYFLRMEEGDPEALTMWKRMRDYSLVEYRAMYDRLGIQFDVYGGESYHSTGMMEQLHLLEEMGLLISPPEAHGAKLVDLEAYGAGHALVVKCDGGTLYLTRYCRCGFSLGKVSI